MANQRLVYCGENTTPRDRACVGGKGHNLLRLYKLAQETGMFQVPDFFIIPTHFDINIVSGPEANYLRFKDNQVRAALDKMKKPVIARSSSPYEDGVNASFAGLFRSVPDQTDYEGLVRALYPIEMSCMNSGVIEYAEKMGINYKCEMAFIVQEQVTDFSERGVIQLEGRNSVTEVTNKRGETSSHEIIDHILDEICPPGEIYSPDETKRTRDWLGEGECWYAVRCAKEAAMQLGLEGTVQVEYLLAPERQPRLVQIRQLPSKTMSHSFKLNLDIPANTPYIESDVCNGIAGEVVLPAYVTFSQSSLMKILIETGQVSGDERADEWRDKSKLYVNEDYMALVNLRDGMRSLGMTSNGGMALLREHDRVWERGNKLFPEYALVCDKLDESITGMDRVTTGKKAIITCLEASKTSHAMTVARDLGIPAMGVRGDIMQLDSFYNQVQTGDIVHMKSDGKRAIAYIKRK